MLARSPEPSFHRALGDAVQLGELRRLQPVVVKGLQQVRVGDGNPRQRLTHERGDFLGTTHLIRFDRGQDFVG